MVEDIKKAIEAIEALNLYEGDEICSTLIKGVINKHVTFLDWKQQEIIDRLPTIGKWVTIYRKYQGEGYVDFERWKIVDRKTFQRFTVEHDVNLALPWPRKRLIVISIERDSFHHAPATRRKIALARVEFVEDWLAKN